jgi:hypothetical protein
MGKETDNTNSDEQWFNICAFWLGSNRKNFYLENLYSENNDKREEAVINSERFGKLFNAHSLLPAAKLHLFIRGQINSPFSKNSSEGKQSLWFYAKWAALLAASIAAIVLTAGIATPFIALIVMSVISGTGLALTGIAEWKKYSGGFAFSLLCASALLFVAGSVLSGGLLPVAIIAIAAASLALFALGTALSKWLFSAKSAKAQNTTADNLSAKTGESEAYSHVGSTSSEEEDEEKNSSRGTIYSCGSTNNLLSEYSDERSISEDTLEMEIDRRTSIHSEYEDPRDEQPFSPF